MKRPEFPRASARKPHKARHPKLILAVICTAQLMAVLDGTIVNIALAHIQRSLHFSTSGLSWVINAYALAFGGLLLLGGRIGDIYGRRRVFTWGTLVFALASLLGGFATTAAWLLVCRATQGLAAAFIAPAALALIATNFEEGRERNSALAALGAVSGSGAVVGLVLGGMITSWLNWRWVLFVNVPIGIVLAILAPIYLAESERRPGKFDLLGALTSTAGLTALVYGFIRAGQDGWRDNLTVGSFVAAALLLIAFVTLETRSRQPITPLHLLRSRNRAGTYAAAMLFPAGLMSVWYFLTLYVQNILGYSALEAGLGFAPSSIALIAAATTIPRWLPKHGPKPFMVAGGVLCIVAMIWMAQMSPSSTYLGTILGPQLIYGFGMGLLFVPLTILAITGVRDSETGAASSLLNVMQQVGASLGLAILLTVYENASRDETTRVLAAGSAQQRDDFAKTGQLSTDAAHQVFTHGSTTAIKAGILFILATVAVCAVVIRRPGGNAGAPIDEAATAEGAAIAAQAMVPTTPATAAAALATASLTAAAAESLGSLPALDPAD